MDTRPPSKVIAVHDYLGSCASVQQLLNESVADLPLSRLTPTEPLEVYCADLRGHNFSEAAPMTSASAYLLACAADIIKMQEDILCSEAGLLGLGFGSLVASCAALHAPDAFSSLTLVVSDIAQLQRCLPSSYPVGELLRRAPAKATGLAELNSYLLDRVPDPAERAALLAAVEVRRGLARFRFSNELLQYTEPFVLSAPAGSTFAKPTVVYICGKDGAISPEEEARVRARFPAVQFVKLDTQGEPLTSPKLRLVPLFLQSCGMLGEIKEANMEQ
ncbi:conserved hypothetical protein [Leishmania major strain Friedlin]|uniref:AB hydrolase-1 domain-containing protein n=1 Tax=Leishmania major TaxID=5664 RepID=Q4Q2C9_LEIMA|nr:conserved hypothetical protein [Leishmania major strain Friedlin]CAG9582294.1 Alpha/beta_hydrolase_family_-_putative [Leishmania major strain Friedlin]CAJ08136.1 conserved hypothetical protein [Leishmania major strain Friedlin]|eukprot:XP_001686519.1 conserved hypothetical protein [Leishmania major strain Friedlin]